MLTNGWMSAAAPAEEREQTDGFNNSSVYRWRAQGSDDRYSHFLPWTKRSAPVINSHMKDKEDLR